MTAIYIHIPFCKQRCRYCDFITYANKENMLPDYVDALQKEILCSPYQVGNAQSLYFGGGTPSLLSVEQLGLILEAVDKRFGIADKAEITLEANPGAFDEGYFPHIRKLGVNRLSMGVQSLEDEELAILGRIHTADKAIQTYLAVREAGFDNVSLDMIFGLPGQSLKDWCWNLEKLVELNAEHFSVYSLILEEGTELTRAIERRDLSLPDDDLVADMYDMTIDTLDSLGYWHYEISSWAKDQAVESRHNKVYWRGEDYLGFGAAAVGCLNGLRWRNTDDISDYVLKIRLNAHRERWANASMDEWKLMKGEVLGPAISEIERLDEDEQMKEMMLLGLRMTLEGVSEKAFYRRFGIDMVERFGKEIDELIAYGLVEWQDLFGGQHLVMTRRGVLLGNRVFSAFI